MNSDLRNHKAPVLAGVFHELGDKMSKWISVNDYLPDNLDAVLIFLDDCIMVATLDGSDFVQDSSQASLYGSEPLGPISKQPTHWMPLPEPPK